ncbi:hypothetical protein [Vibrio sp. D431a]|uniref:hypothetical protein n=1 Tax=Vibrio sp. D431a TaxID=2837388 RepID=UPI0025534659|nr:hypothetical protein [Vibrio sp. D431a]MDK9790172.1 hypothetical protein [Vibrio sp. D431a]
MIATLDFALFRLGENNSPEVLVMKRTDKDKPFFGEYALVGGFIFEEEFFEGQKVDEDDQQATDRILLEKAGFIPCFIIPCGRKGSKDRDPRGWSMTFIHSCPVSQESTKHLDSEGNYKWVSVSDVTEGKFPLISDHAILTDIAWSQLKRTSSYTSAPLYMLPKDFTVKEVIAAYKTLGISITKAGVLTRFVETGIIDKTGEKVSGKGVGKPAQYYRISGTEPTYFSRAI